MTAAVPAPGNGMAVTGFVLALSAFAVTAVPPLWIMAFPCWVCGVVFSAIGVSRSRTLPGRKGRGLAVAGLCVSLGATALLAVLTALFFAGVIGMGLFGMLA